MKKLLLFTIAIIFAALLTACETTSNTGDDNGNNEICIIVDNKDTDLYKKIFENFEKKYPEYKVNPIWAGGDDIQTMQATKIANGSQLDIINGGDMYTEIYRRNLLDLTSYIERDNDELQVNDMVDGILDIMKGENGKYVFLPQTYNCSFLYYNKNLFDAKENELLALELPYEAGTPEGQRHYPNPSWTLDDFFKAAAVLTVFDSKSESYTQWGAETLTSWWGEWLIHVRQSGGELFNSDGYVTFNNDACKTAMQIMRDKSYGNSTLGRAKISAAPGEADLAGFQGGRVAMVYGGHTANWTRYDSVGLNWGMTVLPTGTLTRNGAEFAVAGYGINKTSKNKDAAWALIKYLNSAECIDEIVACGGLPIRKSSLAKMAEGEQKERCSLAMEAINPNGKYGAYATSLPRFEYFVEVANTVASSEIGLMMANDKSKISIEDCIKNIENKANNLIEINYR